MRFRSSRSAARTGRAHRPWTRVVWLAAVWALPADLPSRASAQPARFYRVEAGASPSWAAILESIGLAPAADSAARADIVVQGPGAASAPAARFLILEGDSPAARELGVVAGEERVTVRGLRDQQRPGLSILWERSVELPRYIVPPAAEIRAAERHSGAPLVAAWRRDSGVVLWTATSPGERGYERFPYILHALNELGLEPPFRSSRLWLFLDGAYRTRVDLEYFARRWRAAGAAAVHVAAWHYFEPDPERDAWLRALVEACHRNAVQVYAWLELPHVGERFWEQHPEWREQTALLHDAHLDWRKLMNLANPECARAVADGIHRLLGRFDWDGVNLAELYFESLEGHANPARFTPMNPDVRAEYRRLHGMDPYALFHGPGAADDQARRRFLDYRADLARRLQEEWIEQIEQARARRPHLDLVLTHVDDRHDPSMRDRIGADSSRTLPLLERYDFTFLIEDPATVWDAGPERYRTIAREYEPLTPRQERLAIDINVVERYQDVYPTRQPTGTELLLQAHQAASAFPRVALYAEHSLLRPDLPLLAAAAAAAETIAGGDGRLTVASRAGTGARWAGPARVDGKEWPLAGDGFVWLPGGTHTIEPGGRTPAVRVVDFNGDPLSAAAHAGGAEIAYRSAARAFAVLERRPARLEVDEVNVPVRGWEGERGFVTILPRGQHIARFFEEAGPEPRLAALAARESDPGR